MLLLFKKYYSNMIEFSDIVHRLNSFVEYNHFSMISFQIIELLSDKGLESIILSIP